MSGFLEKMLYALTSAYTRKDYENVKISSPPETNIGKMFAILSWGLDIASQQADVVRAWDDLDNARGSVLDRYGRNFGVERNGATDDFYRIAIRVKVLSQLSGGDADTLINAAADLFDVDTAEVELENVFPAKIRIYVNAVPIPENRLKLVGQITKELKRLVAAGVGMMLYLVYVIKHTIEVSSDIQLYPYTAPFCNTIYCGTHPQSATVGWTELAEVKAQFEILTSLYITRLSGTYPHVKTAFREVRSVILMQPYPDAAAYNAPQSGEGITGLHPGRATEGWVVDAAIVPGGDISDAVYKGKFSGTEPGISTVSGLVHAPVEADARAIAVGLDSTPVGDRLTGTAPDKAGLGYSYFAEVSATENTVEAGKYVPKRSNMNRSGEIPDVSTIAGVSKADMEVAGHTDSFVVDGPFEAVPAGTKPSEVSVASRVETSTVADCSAEGFTVNAPLCNTKYCGQK